MKVLYQSFIEQPNCGPFSQPHMRGRRGHESWELFMDGKEPAYFDLKTVALLRETVEDAWISIRPEQRVSVSRSLLAERVLKAAAQGERDRGRLLDAALGGTVAGYSVKARPAESPL
jgi:hypothetical protein